MKEIQTSTIEYMDVVIVGGGIAGIAIAEFLSRHSRFSIKLLEKAEYLGTQSSGKLEGWFHSGALYSAQDDAQTFINCVNGVEDLINLYAPYFPKQCNIALKEIKTDFFTPKIIPEPQGWFNDAPVYFIHPQTDSPEVCLSSLKSDLVQVEIQRNRVLGRLEAAYGEQYNWRSEHNCLAPTYAQIENYESLNCSLRHSPEMLRNLCRQFDASYGIEASDYEIIRSLDSSMNTSTILRDLVASALNQGVTFETGITVEQPVIDPYGSIRIKSLLCKTKEGLRKRIKADLFIFTVGESFESFLSDLQVRARLKKSLSSMVVAYPALVDTNFVRMSTKNKFHFNHFVQQQEVGGEQFSYSLLADSGYTNIDDESEVDIEPILESAQRYFGKDKLYSRQLFSYDCVKTEFISEEEQKRRYSYWIESRPESNYMCILPGKFSFFPTVAFQAYQRIKTLIDFEECVSNSPFQPETGMKKEAARLVADSYPVQILTQKTATNY